MEAEDEGRWRQKMKQAEDEGRWRQAEDGAGRGWGRWRQKMEQTEADEECGKRGCT